MTLRNLLTAGACAAVLAGLSPNAAAQNLIVNGGFDTDLSGWTTTPTAPVTIAWDAGTAALARNDSTASANGNYLYQNVSVVNGAQYLLSADWYGDLLNGGTGRNWAEVYINFGGAPLDPTVAPGTINYKKATDGGPNDVPMPWTTQDITASPDGAGPVDGIFTATGDYMLVAFNLGGRAQTSNDTQPGFYNVDNVSLTLVPEPSSIALLGLAGLGLMVRRFRR